MQEPEPAPPTPPQTATVEQPRARRPYTPPRLEVLGNLRDLTLGPSAGIGDLADPLNRSET